MDKQNQKVKVAALSIISNTSLVILKIIGGFFTGSVSIVSEAAHSGMDLIASVVAFLAVRVSNKKPDEQHQFGHGKIEDISALVEALLIFVAAIWIVIESIHKLINPQPLETISWGILIMAIAVVTNVIISSLLFNVGKKTNSPALIADAWHLRTDVYTSLGVTVALMIIWIGNFFWPGIYLNWIDPVAAIFVALLIFQAAYRLTADAIKDLIDTSTPENELIWLHEYLKGWYPTVRSVHRIRTRKSGAFRFIDLHVVVNSAMSVSESHDITEKMTDDIKEKLEGADVTVHIEPCNGECTGLCIQGCFFTAEERRSVLKVRA